MLGRQTLSPGQLKARVARGSRGKVAHADVHGISTRLTTSASPGDEALRPGDRGPRDHGLRAVLAMAVQVQAALMQATAP